MQQLDKTSSKAEPNSDNSQIYQARLHGRHGNDATDKIKHTSNTVVFWGGMAALIAPLKLQSTRLELSRNLI